MSKHVDNFREDAMSKNFFTQPEVIKKIEVYKRKLTAEKEGDAFCSKRNEYILLMLNNFLEESEKWDELAKVNVRYISDKFYDELNYLEMTKESLDVMFSYCFRFLLELYINTPYELEHPYSSIKGFAVHELDYFDVNAKRQIEYALRELPVAMVKQLISGQELRALKDFLNATETAKKLKKDWDNELKQKGDMVNALKAELDKHEDAFNFVGLYAGFAKLGRMKAAEYFWSKLVLFIIGIILPLSIFFEALYFSGSHVSFDKPLDLMKLLPAISLTILLVYYFRVALNNYSSIRAQMMQIELRKSLCRFIQSYAEYAKEIKSNDKDVLEKFESVIFSNIMVEEGKIPSTFDGLEQVTSLIKSLKGTK